MSNETVIDIQSFKGLNLREDPGAIGDHELQSCLNYNLGRAGELIKRNGFEKINNANLGPNAIKLIGYYNTSTFALILARIGNYLYYSVDAQNWTLVPGQGTAPWTVDFGCQYTDKFYMVRKGGLMLEWAITAYPTIPTPTTVAGSPGGDFCIIHKERIFILDSSGTGQPNYRIYFSNVGSATDWGTGAGSIDVNAGDGDFLVGCAIVHDLLLVFKTRATWGIYVQGTNKLDWVTRSLNKSVGCTSKYSIRVVEDLCYFVSAIHIYKTDGTSFRAISDPISPVLRDRIVNLTNSNIDAAFFWNDMYVVLLQPTPSTYRYFAYHLRADGWTEWFFAGGIAPTSFLEIRNSIVPAPGVYAGELNPNGNMYRYGSNIYSDGAGSAYAASFKTKDFDLGARAYIKRGKWLSLDTTGLATLTLTHTVNGVAGTPVTVTTAAGSQAQKAVGPGFFRTWALELVSAGNVAFQFMGLSAFIHKKRTQIGASV